MASRLQVYFRYYRYFRYCRYCRYCRYYRCYRYYCHCRERHAEVLLAAIHRALRPLRAHQLKSFE